MPDRERLDAPWTPPDVLAVQAVLVGYADALDLRRGDPNALARVFSEGVEVDYGEIVGHPLRGFDAVARSISVGMRRYRTCQHFVSNFDIECSGDQATSTSYVFAHYVLADRPADLQVGAVYRDVLIRTSDGWKIHRRDVSVLWERETADPSEHPKE